MSDSPSSRLVAGEPLDVLAQVLQHIKTKRARNGMIDVDVTLQRELGVVFTRALMRVEAELLQQDADALSDKTFATLRSPGARRNAAFTALILRIADAASA